MKVEVRAEGVDFQGHGERFRKINEDDDAVTAPVRVKDNFT